MAASAQAGSSGSGVSGLNLNLKEGFPQKVGVCVAVMAVIHIFPKSKDPNDGVRLIFTVAYFGAAMLLLFLLNKPRADYMKKQYEFRFQEAGPALAQNWRSYLSALNRFCSIGTSVLLVFVGANAIRVLSRWFTPLSALGPVATIAWWGSLAGIVLFPMWGRTYLSQVRQRRQLLHEAIETSEFHPRDMSELEAEKEKLSRPPVEIAKGDRAFTAGGFDWKWDDFYKNGIVFGMTGSGKTITVLNALLDGLLVSTHKESAPCAGLILDPKGDYMDKLGYVCSLYHREQDIVTIDPDDPEHSIRWNPLDSDDDELEVASRFAGALECLGMAGGNDTFWIDSAKKFIRHAINLLRITNPPGEPPSLIQIGNIASSLKRLSETADKVADDDPRGDQCLAYFADEWAVLADNTRSSILAFITNMVDPFMMPVYDKAFSGRSTYKISEMIDQGKILYVHIPIAEKPNMSKVICTFVKLEFYREILKRNTKTRGSFFFCDEFQVYFTPMAGKGDSDFFERSRASKHANIIATQNFPGLVKVAGEKESVVRNLLGNCAVKIFLRNTDDGTNDFASKIFGQSLVGMSGASLSQGSGKGSASAGASVNQQYDQKVRPEEFINLAVPVEGVCGYAETIVHLASRATVTKEKLRWRVHTLKPKE